MNLNIRAEILSQNLLAKRLFLNKRPGFPSHPMSRQRKAADAREKI